MRPYVHDPDQSDGRVYLAHSCHMPMILPEEATKDWLNPKYNALEVLQTVMTETDFMPVDGVQQMRLTRNRPRVRYATPPPAPFLYSSKLYKTNITFTHRFRQQILADFDLPARCFESIFMHSLNIY